MCESIIPHIIARRVSISTALAKTPGSKRDDLVYVTDRCAWLDGLRSTDYPGVDHPGEGVTLFRAVITDMWSAFLSESPRDITALDWANSRADGVPVVV